MGRLLRLGLLVSILTSCGGGAPWERPVGFINQTRHADADLWIIWQSAQKHLAKQIDLNPLQQSFAGAPAHLLPGDSHALDLQPRQIEVTAEEDVPASLLESSTGTQRPDPTGMIACPHPCEVRYAPAYSVYEKAATKYAASWEAEETNFSTILQYEFENHMLNALGYDTRWR